jgi:hypothetical protein
MKICPSGCNVRLTLNLSFPLLWWIRPMQNQIKTRASPNVWENWTSLWKFEISSTFFCFNCHKPIHQLISRSPGNTNDASWRKTKTKRNATSASRYAPLSPEIDWRRWFFVSVWWLSAGKEGIQPGAPLYTRQVIVIKIGENDNVSQHPTCS